MPEGRSLCAHAKCYFAQVCILRKVCGSSWQVHTGPCIVLFRPIMTVWLSSTCTPHLCPYDSTLLTTPMSLTPTRMQPLQLRPRRPLKVMWLLRRKLRQQRLVMMLRLRLTRRLRCDWLLMMPAAELSYLQPSTLAHTSQFCSTAIVALWTAASIGPKHQC